MLLGLHFNIRHYEEEEATEVTEECLPLAF